MCRFVCYSSGGLEPSEGCEGAGRGVLSTPRIGVLSVFSKPNCVVSVFMAISVSCKPCCFLEHIMTMDQAACCWLCPQAFTCSDTLRVRIGQIDTY